MSCTCETGNREQGLTRYRSTREGNTLRTSGGQVKKDWDLKKKVWYIQVCKRALSTATSMGMIVTLRVSHKFGYVTTGQAHTQQHKEASGASLQELSYLKLLLYK